MLGIPFEVGPARNSTVGIYVGVCKFKHIHYSYNSVCYELSLTAGTEPIHYDYCRLR